ncbi:L-xylulose reductase-like [Anneissia japonica]|uniref:L-xylulose reductase-like n=1 Tax=Anneissia japonica TaxID=1529436 RepID=UPI0014258D4E|nr:L-xylulose reductase-like [Anneissia japonica]
MSTNLRSAFFASQAALPFLKESKGNVVNVSSCVSLTPNKYCAYTISKAGMDQLTMNTAKAFAEYGIRVNSVHPGVVVTKLFDPACFSHDQVVDFAKELHVLQKRPIKFDELAAAVAFLASEHAAMITGCIMPIDGGYHLVN